MADSSKKKKDGLGKTVQKGFYKVFNDKSPVRRIVFSAAFVMTPTIMMSQSYHETESGRAPAGAEQRVAKYSQEIAGYSQTVTLQKSQPTLEQSKQGDNLYSRLIHDETISEKSVRDLARQFNAALGSTHNAKMAMLENYTPYLEEGRKSFAKQPGFVPDEALENAIYKSHLSDVALSFSVAWLIFFSTFDSALRTALRHGRRKDDDNIHQEKVEKFEDAKNDLKDILKPKGPYGRT